MTEKYFIDTNIFIYSFDHSNTSKQITAKKIIRKALKDNMGCISSQVVQEFLNVATKKFASPFNLKDCQNYLNAVLEPLCEVFPSTGLFNQSLELADRWQLSFYDALIIGAALQGECRFIFTEDLQHGQVINGLTITNPFLTIESLN